MRGLLAISLAACSSAAPSSRPLGNKTERTEQRTKPTLDEVRSAIDDLDGAAPYLGQSADTATALEILGEPLWFDGFTYSSVQHGDLQTRCTRTSGTLYAHDERKQLAECLVIADWRHSDINSLEELAPGRLPVVFHQHRARIGELADDHLIVYSHFCPAAPGDFWTLFAAGKDSAGRVLLDAILVSNDDEGDCRTDNGAFE